MAISHFRLLYFLASYICIKSYQVEVLPPQQLRQTQPLRPINVVLKHNDICLETSVYRFQSSSLPKVEVDLYSMVHIGDKQYYDEIATLMNAYDVVLYELITSKKNINALDGFKKSLCCEIVPSKVSQDLATKFSLKTQLDLPLQSSNWYLADLDSESIMELEHDRKGTTLANYWSSVIGGRGFNKRTTLNKFFMSDTPFITILRILLFVVAPCPELSCLLLDWSRMSPKGGGLSQTTLVLLVRFLSAGQLKNIPKALFMQQLLNGLPDSGNWGGESQSDVAVRVGERNRECLRILQRFLADEKPPRKVAILYGAYHVSDLKSRIEKTLNFMPVPFLAQTAASPSGTTLSSLRAWTIPLPPCGDNQSTSDNRSVATSLSIKNEDVPVLAVAALAYLALGTLDWLVLAKIILEIATESDHILASKSLIALAEGSHVTILALLAFVFSYLFLYVQRHLQLLRSISAFGIQWDRGLFED